ncbi:MAG: asparagine synthase (glutamine-hydrolyzing) [Ferruginibacter sp.]
MCRIAGILNKSISSSSLEQIVQSMCNSLIHGGPDDGGIYSSPTENLVLGNRRLALQDLTSAGHQPMEFADRYTITYNGELYNFLTLKDELIAKGYKFSNHTDTEVILASFAEWNTQAFARFNGMYAFALWDNLDKELFLVRDPSGMKPLYYSTVSGGICFASEIRALKNIPFLDKENEKWPVYYMAYGHIPEPVTTLMGVSPLKKGCFLKYNYNSGKTSFQSFKHYCYSPSEDDKSLVVNNIRTLINASVKRHLISDAPIGVFLSGGLDSSILTAVASSINNKNLNTLSLYFNEENFSEKKYQDVLLNQLKCDSFQHLLTEEEFLQNFPTIIDDMDMPSCDGINTWFISKFAKSQGLKAVLSGVGGDELFGGYPSFSRMKIARALQKLPNLALRSGRRSSKKQLNRLSYLSLDGIKGIYLLLRGHFDPIEIAKQLQASEKEVWNILNDLPVFNDIDVLGFGNQASWMEFNLYMQNQLLRDSDVMGMAHGVEIRVPFLDDELIKYTLKIDNEVKYGGPFKKQLLIDSFSNVVPSEIYTRPKMGFSFPFADWMGNSEFVKEQMMGGNEITLKNYKKFENDNLHWSQLLLLLHLRIKGKA